MEEDAPQPPDITARTDREEAVFATGLVAYKPNNMVWLDFVQANPAALPPGRAQVVSRVVVHPAVLDDIIAKLSALRDQ